MALEGRFTKIMRCNANTIHHNNDGDTHPKEVNHPFCFPETNSFLIDPALLAELNVAEKFKLKNERKQLIILNTMRRFKEKLESMTLVRNNNDYRVERLKESVEIFRGVLEENWPETINEDLEEESDPDLELIEINDKIPKLTEQLGHGKTKWSAEKQIIKDLEHLHGRKELLDRQVKEAEANEIPKPTKNNGRWFSGSKFDVKRKIRGYLKKIREFEKQEQDAIMKRNREVGEIETKLVTLEKEYNILKQEEEKANVCRLMLETQVKKAEEYFMSQWTNDSETSATHTRIIQQALFNGDL